jgi:murein DD-endopeptidase MepM/ murein hydrolase activator NlpD
MLARYVHFPAWMRYLARSGFFGCGVLAGTLGLYGYLRYEGVMPTRVAAAASRARVVEPVMPVARVMDDDIHNLLRRDLSMPIANVPPMALEDTFTRPRPGRKTHEAMDIPAPRGTPIHAIGDGVIAKLSTSARGGITIYQFDPDQAYCYSYAHLDRYANHLREGMRVKHGDVIGYVGTTGDAPADGPHLHLAIARLHDDRHWWEGAPVNPYPVLKAIATNAYEGTN